MNRILIIPIFIFGSVVTAAAADYGYGEQRYVHTESIPQAYVAPVPMPQQNTSQTVVIAQPQAPVYAQPRCHSVMVRDDILDWVWLRRDVCDMD